MKDVITDLGGSELYSDELCYFVVAICKLKGISHRDISPEIIEGGNQYSDCCDKYSKEKFNKICQNKYFRILASKLGDDNLKACF